MTLPLPEVCQRILALHVLLGFSDGKDERRLELLQLLLDHGLNWNSLPEFFAAMKITTATPLPGVDTKAWKKRCEKLCHMYAAMGSSDNYGATAYKKFISERAKQQFNSIDIAAILAAYWIHHNPPSSSASTPQPDRPQVDVFELTKHVIEDRVVLSPAASIVATLIAINSHVYEQFGFVPQLGIVAPSSGRGKSRLLTVLQRLVARPWASKHASAPGIYRHLRRQPRSTLLLDALEKLNVRGDSVLCSILEMAAEGGSKDLVEDGESIKIEIRVPVIWAIRGAIRDVALSLLSRGCQIEMQHGTPRIQLRSWDDPVFFEDLDIAREEIAKFAATCSFDFNPEIPIELRSDKSRLHDVSSTLLSLADSLGHGPEARAALIDLAATRPPQDDGLQLLKDVKLVFEVLEIDRIFKEDLTDQVIQRGDPMWGHYRGPNNENKTAHPLRPAELGRLLERFHVYPRTVWPKGPRRPGVKSHPGYYWQQIEKACAENLGSDSTTSSQARKIMELANPNRPQEDHKEDKDDAE
jgi:hypothetical protein